MTDVSNKIDLIDSGARRVVYVDGFRRDGIIGLLRDRILEITFIKKDGTSRYMMCTLRQDKLPKVPPGKEVEPKDNPEIIKVWDMGKSAWRSFRVDSIEQIEDKDHKHAIIYVKRS